MKNELLDTGSVRGMNATQGLSPFSFGRDGVLFGGVGRRKFAILIRSTVAAFAVAWGGSSSFGGVFVSLFFSSIVPHSEYRAVSFGFQPLEGLVFASVR